MNDINIKVVALRNISNNHIYSYLEREIYRDYITINLNAENVLTEIKSSFSTCILIGIDEHYLKVNWRELVNTIANYNYEKIIIFTQLTATQELTLIVKRVLKSIGRDIVIIKETDLEYLYEKIISYPYVYANAQSNKNQETAFLQSIIDSQRLIPIPKHRAKDIKLAKTLAREHYERFEGNLPLLGDIEHYIYHDGYGVLYEIGLDNKIVKLYYDKESRVDIRLGHWK